MSRQLMPCRLLIDPPSNGAWNMAVDEVLLEDVAQSGQPVLRFYQWSRPTLSLGYFQQADDRATHAASTTADLVRRLSGGGAILHDRELTYSLVLPAAHPLAHETQQLYDAVHGTLLTQLSELLSDSNDEWKPMLCNPSHGSDAQDEPFLCFQRRSEGDILLSRSAETDGPIDHKIIGSAQRRRRGTVLQHGSILLHRSQAAPELPGITDITQSEISTSSLLDKLPSKLATATGLELQRVRLTEKQADHAQQLQQAKYQSAGWTQRR